MVCTNDTICSMYSRRLDITSRCQTTHCLSYSIWTLCWYMVGYLEYYEGTKTMKYIQGSVMNMEFFEKLQKTKSYLEAIKSYKLELRHQKNIQKDWSQNAVLNHIKQEMVELDEGFDRNDDSNIIEELADVINCCEILATMILY